MFECVECFRPVECVGFLAGENPRLVGDCPTHGRRQPARKRRWSGPGPALMRRFDALNAHHSGRDNYQHAVAVVLKDLHELGFAVVQAGE